MPPARPALTSGSIQRDLWPQAAVEPLRVRRAPLLAAAVCFAIGTVMARHWQPPIVLLLALALLAALAWLGFRQSARASIAAVAAIWVVTGLWCAEIQPVPSAQQTLLTYADGLSRTVRGHIIRIQELPPNAPTNDADTEARDWSEDAAETQPATLSIDLALDSIEQVTPDLAWMVPLADGEGGIRITVLGTANTFTCGDLLEAPVRLKVPERYRDPGAWQYADYLLDQGIGAHANIKAAAITRLPKPLANWNPRCRLYAAQAWAANRLTRYIHSRANNTLPALARLSPDDAGMLNAMLFGDRTRLSHTLRLGFERTGSFHLFVVSGMHVALLAGGIFWFSRRLRLGDLSATLLTIALTTAYALITGFGAPIQRALAMATIFLITRLLSRDRSVLNALGAAALVVLVWSPRSLFEASFQMTFLAIVAIAGIAIPLGEWSFLPHARATRNISDRWLDVGLPPRLAQLRVMLRLFGEPLTPIHRRAATLPARLLRSLLWALELFLIGIVAEMVMVLPMAIYFHRATVFALPTNMLSIPLVAVLAPAAILTFLASLLNPWLAALPGAATALLLHGIIAIIGHITHVASADLRIPGPALWIALCVVACWVFCCWAVRHSLRGAVIATIVLPLAAVAVLWPEPSLTTPGQLEVTAIDIGQGDSLLLVAPTGQTMLMDAGGPTGALRETSEATSRFDVGEQVVAPYLWSRRIRRLDILALSHAHSDHMGGMPAILRSFHPRELWVSIDPSSAAYADLLREAATLGIAVRHLHAGQTLPWAGTQVEVLAPAATYTNPRAPTNDDSLVLRLQYGQSSVLLAGDAEAASERAMLTASLLHPVTLLKVGHHGSRTSTGLPFLTALAPHDAIISVGRNNTFGHPRAEVITRLAEAHTRLYRTDEFGLTTFLLTPDGQIQEITGAADN
ncbi:ComEC/Rec2 family competence protein [Granulicella arctica]|uniref:ComEC/Rec2 family competence protein n=1 Tax=Granulicella arctica TaxID=940613 RepID=UPI0021E09407|nr:ComEC/Rec2 family competence protein [Granulicella arctica]